MPVYLQKLQVKVIYQGYRVKVKVTAAKYKIQNTNYNNLRTCRVTSVFSSNYVLVWLKVTIVLFSRAGSGRVVYIEQKMINKVASTCKWIVICNVCSTVRCHRSVTRTATVLLTRRASSTHTTLHSSSTRPTSSLTAPGPGTVQLLQRCLTSNDCLPKWYKLRRRVTLNVIMFTI